MAAQNQQRFGREQTSGGRPPSFRNCLSWKLRCPVQADWQPGERKTAGKIHSQRIVSDRRRRDVSHQGPYWNELESSSRKHSWPGLCLTVPRSDSGWCSVNGIGAPICPTGLRASVNEYTRCAAKHRSLGGLAGIRRGGCRASQEQRHGGGGPINARRLILASHLQPTVHGTP